MEIGISAYIYVYICIYIYIYIYNIYLFYHWGVFHLAHFTLGAAGAMRSEYLNEVPMMMIVYPRELVFTQYCHYK